ncbi:MAG: MFS transporter [Deltaproteobacteria bacterium]|nr:MFS transporter [Deltaproteobacteria bacterium]
MNVGSPRLFSLGDLNAFFALLVDNVVNLVMLAAILVEVFGFPADFVMTRMVPGTALGVMVGDLAYSWMAMRKGSQATAMPLGLDTPSTIGIAMAVLGPAYLASGDPYAAWEVGMATMVFMGVAKLALSFAGDAVLRWIPRAGLLGPLAGIGVALLGLFPMLKVFSIPLAGLTATGLVLFALVAKHSMPGRIPGALAAVVCGLVMYWLTRALGLDTGTHDGVSVVLGLSLPVPELEHVVNGLPNALKYLPVAVPFGLLTVVGGINVTESARVAGDDYRTRDILLVEAGATLVAGVFGGVAQSTPYIGHPAYKAMGARSGYTLATGLVVGIGGVMGLLGAFIELLPEVVVAPILLFVGLEITAQAFAATERRHHAALAFSMIPVLAYLVSIYTGRLMAAGARPDPVLAGQIATIGVLGHGFILTAMLWGAALAFLIDRRPWAVLASFAALAVFSLFGVIHSIDPGGAIYLPGSDSLPWELAVSYLMSGLMLAGLVRFGPIRQGEL